ncbi:MAG: MmcB family DNA repair protein [Rhodospirillales bacterium]
MNKIRRGQIPTPFDFDFHGDALAADDIARSVCRLFSNLGFSPLTEFPLSNNRRVDVIGLAKDGGFLVAEVKASERDFRADGKWPEYLTHCDAFYFAVAGGFPLDLIPPEAGIIVADSFHGAIVREAPRRKMNTTRRRNQILKFGLKAAKRLHTVRDPRR